MNPKFILEYYNCLCRKEHWEYFLTRQKLTSIEDIVNFFYSSKKYNIYKEPLCREINIKQKNLLLNKKVVVKDLECLFREQINANMSVHNILISDHIAIKKMEEDVFPDINIRKLLLYYKRESYEEVYVDDFEFLIFYLLLRKLINNKNLLHFNDVDFITRSKIYPKSMECYLREPPSELGILKFNIKINVFSNPIILAGCSTNSNAFFSKPVYGKNVYIKDAVKYSPDHIKLPILYIPRKKLDMTPSSDKFFKNGKDISYQELKEEDENDPEKIINYFLESILELDKYPLI